jgi:hypothetical protein
MRTGLTVEHVLQALSDEWMPIWQIAARTKWIPAPEVIARYQKANKKVTQTHTQCKVDLVRLRMGAGSIKDRIEKRMINNVMHYRINKHGKAHLATLQDQAGRKHTAKGGTRRKSNRRVQGSIPGGSDDAAPGGDV